MYGWQCSRFIPRLIFCLHIGTHGAYKFKELEIGGPSSGNVDDAQSETSRSHLRLCPRMTSWSCASSIKINMHESTHPVCNVGCRIYRGNFPIVVLDYNMSPMYGWWQMRDTRSATNSDAPLHISNTFSHFIEAKPADLNSSALSAFKTLLAPV